MTSHRASTNSDTRQLRPISELQKLVQGVLRDTDVSDVVGSLDEALGCYENYKKALKEEVELDYEKAYIYYQIARALVTEKIPTLEDWSQYANSPKSLKRAFYNDLKDNILQDGSILSVIEYIRDHSPTPSPFNFSHNGTIKPNQMKMLVEKYPDDVLIIDFRVRDEFKKNHIRSKNIINIDPISIRQNYRDVDIEELSLVTSPDSERELFSKRDTFELIIIYDYVSTSITQDSLARLYRILTMRSFDKPLKRPPVILEGGINGWVSTYGLSNFGHNHGDLTMPERLLTRRPSQNSRSTTGIVRNFNDYLSNPTKADLSPLNTQKRVVTEQRIPSTLPKQQPIPLKRSSSMKIPNIFPSSPSSRSSPSSQPNRHLQSSPQQQNWASSPPPSRNGTPQPAIFSTQLAPSSNSTEVLTTEKLHFTTGLHNIGNSCYMNCVIQCLLGTVTFSRIFVDGSYQAHVNINSKLGSKGIMARYFSELAKALYQNNNRVYEPRNFKSVVGSLNYMFRNTDQQDCSEFLNFVLDGLHEDLNECGSKPRPPPSTKEEEMARESMSIRTASTIEWEKYLVSDFSAIVHLFQGQFSSRLKCLECGTTSTTFQSFSVLSLPIPEQYINTRYEKIPLDKCFEEFTKLEVLDGDNRWHCSKCKQLRKSTKQITITRMPMNLIVHLKRFRAGSSYQKVTTFIDYPFKMELTKYWPPFEGSEEEAKLMSTLPVRNQVPPFKYRLYAVANHSGSLGSGHYTAFVMKGGVKKWCYFDDTRVTKNVPEANVINSNAYVLFYGRE
ncbi:CYFA0S36e00628g1_1 [Cyberlindnera fabianii]|uniref:Ubiquitin carboxyl-terminal hydrolase n=1 Tax=Cyberlindnera fabianii TaxID=36022 RepID=A0A061BEB4_CYBFA|nr:CYFA0S36e00628g1_1 [Cyberlindnera fabianii]